MTNNHPQQPQEQISSNSTTKVEPPSIFESVIKGVGEFAVTATLAAQSGKNVVETAFGIGSAISHTVAQTGKAVVETTTNVSSAISQTTSETGKNVVATATGVGEVVSNSVTQTGKIMLDTATGMSTVAAQQMLGAIEQATQNAGQTISFLTDNWFLKRLTGILRLDWLMGAADRVDLEKAQATVRKLQQEHPQETPSQIAHRLMVEKAMYGGGVGLVTSLVPGQAMAFLAVDLATTTMLQAEMVYQIAAAYGLDLKDPARKGEVLGIFGLALGGSRALKAGVTLLRNLPLAGMVIGASSNAVILYTLGYAACRFYEARGNAATTETALVDVKEGSEQYLEKAIAQQAVMDQILVHTILASHPEKSWEKILPELQKLNFSPASLEAIAANINSPQPIDSLLNQLSRDYAMPLLAQCYRIAQSEGITTPAEQEIIDKIAAKFDINLNQIKQIVEGDRPLTNL
ncbi:MAG TPA: hypothetical protein V6D15_01530 [Oculatellaceae cyanobacterium]|jgi:uncharacterized protein (DUF697 family)